MDSLRELPVDDKSALNVQQKQLLEKYIGSAAPNVSKESNTNTSTEGTPKWKTILYISALFLALLNPVTQSIFSKIPKVGESYTYILALTTLLFVVGTAGVLYVM